MDNTELEELEVEDEEINHIKNFTSYCETLMHLLKGNIGIGLYAMGDAFRNGGLLVAPFAMIFLVTICIHCQHQLLNASDYLKDRFNMETYPGYAKTVRICISLGHPKFRKTAPVMATLVNTFICMTHLGFCCVYFVFIPSNLRQVIKVYIVDMDIIYHQLIIVLPILLTCLIPDLKILAPVSTLANFLMLFSIIIIMYFLCQDIPPISDRVYVASFSQLALFFGTIFFACSGVGFVVPMKREMKNPEEFSKRLGVLNMGSVIMVIFFIIVGFLSYLKCGENIEGSVTLNLDPENILSQLVKIFTSFAIMFSFAVQFYIAMVVLWTPFVKRFGPFEHARLVESLFRTFFVFITFVLALIIPYLGYFISLVGATFGITLSLLFPPLLEMMHKWIVSEITVLITVKNVFIILIGMFGCLLGTYQSIIAIINIMRNPDQ